MMYDWCTAAMSAADQFVSDSSLDFAHNIASGAHFTHFKIPKNNFDMESGCPTPCVMVSRGDAEGAERVLIMPGMARV